MTTQQYLDLVKKTIIKNIDNLVLNHSFSSYDLKIIQVWYCKTIQNHKGLFVIKNNDIDIVYPYFIEATYNGDNKELYLDYYTKQFKTVIDCE